MYSQKIHNQALESSWKNTLQKDMYSEDNIPKYTKMVWYYFQNYTVKVLEIYAKKLKSRALEGVGKKFGK